MISLNLQLQTFHLSPIIHVTVFAYFSIVYTRRTTDRLYFVFIFEISCDDGDPKSQSTNVWCQLIYFYKILTRTFLCAPSQQIPDEFDKGESSLNFKQSADCERLCCRVRRVLSRLFDVADYMNGWLLVTVEPTQTTVDRHPKMAIS